MDRIVENRASFILYNIILSNKLDEGVMLLPANICPIVPATLLKAKTKFEFVDINADNLLLDCESALGRLREADDIGSVLVNSTFGFENDFEEFFSDIKKVNKDIFIINDRCMNIPYLDHIDTNADVVLHSTGYSKYVDFSFGGYAFIKNDVIYDRRNINYLNEDHDNLVCAFDNVLKGNSKFDYLDSDWLDGTPVRVTKEDYFENIFDKLQMIDGHKKRVNQIYRENLKSEICLATGYNDWRFNILVNNKKEVLSEIFKSNLFASSHYQSLVGIFGHGIGINAEQLHSRVINLFNDYRFSEKQAYSITKVINKYAK